MDRTERFYKIDQMINDRKLVPFKDLREVSPQRLAHYRENWYLDAWCHMREGLRNFAVDSISRVEVLEKKAKDVSRYA